MVKVQVELNVEFVNMLKKLARQESWYDLMGTDPGLTTYDFAGSNIDDAMYGGYAAGEIHMARETLNEVGIPWED